MRYSIKEAIDKFEYYDILDLIHRPKPCKVKRLSDIVYRIFIKFILLL